MEPSELLPVLLVGYGLVLGFPLYLYVAVVRGRAAEQSTSRKALLAFVPLAVFAFALVPHCTDDAAALLVLGSVVMFSFAKTLETVWNTHDATVRENFHRFCLYFAIPSDVSFPAKGDKHVAAFQDVRMQAMRRLGYAAFESVLLALLLGALHVVDLVMPAIIHPEVLWPHSGYLDVSAYFHSGLVFTLESFASFLCIRIVLNGFLLAGTQLAHGDGILVRDCWGDLTFATSLRQGRIISHGVERRVTDREGRSGQAGTLWCTLRGTVSFISPCWQARCLPHSFPHHLGRGKLLP